MSSHRDFGEIEGRYKVCETLFICGGLSLEDQHHLGWFKCEEWLSSIHQIKHHGLNIHRPYSQEFRDTVWFCSQLTWEFPQNQDERFYFFVNPCATPLQNTLVHKQSLTNLCCPEAPLSSLGLLPQKVRVGFWGHQGALLPSGCLENLQIARGSPLTPPSILSRVLLVGRFLANSSVRNSSFENNGSEEMEFEIQDSFIISQSKWRNIFSLSHMGL